MLIQKNFSQAHAGSDLTSFAGCQDLRLKIYTLLISFSALCTSLNYNYMYIHTFTLTAFEPAMAADPKTGSLSGVPELCAFMERLIKVAKDVVTAGWERIDVKRLRRNIRMTQGTVLKSTFLIIKDTSTRIDHPLARIQRPGLDSSGNELVPYEPPRIVQDTTIEATVLLTSTTITLRMMH